jgi:hypothetical protein
MKNGFIYPLIKILVDGLNKLNLVEYFKGCLQVFNRVKTDESIQSYNNFAIDIFRIVKWLFLALAIFCGASNCWVQAVIWYLLLTNIYTYFYYHLWRDEALEPGQVGQNNHHRVRKRFVNLFIAVFYSDLCFAYLYEIPYVANFTWGKSASLLHAFWFSVSNSIAANYNVVVPITDLGNSVAMIQLLITFAFITIILSRINSQTTS